MKLIQDDEFNEKEINCATFQLEKLHKKYNLEAVRDWERDSPKLVFSDLFEIQNNTNKHDLETTPTLFSVILKYI